MSVAAPRRRWQESAVHSDSPIDSAAVSVAEVVPANLLDGGEVIVLAIKPSLWFIPLVSLRWIGLTLLVVAAVRFVPLSGWALPLMQLSALLLLARLALATVQWSTRLYVLTNRRVMRIRGILSVQVFECALTRIVSTEISLSPSERMVRVGTLRMSTAGGPPSTASWRMVARPLDVHEQLREAIRRAQNRGNHVG